MAHCFFVVVIVSRMTMERRTLLQKYGVLILFEFCFEARILPASSSLSAEPTQADTAASPSAALQSIEASYSSFIGVL